MNSEIAPIARIRSLFPTKFGIPRQSNVVEQLPATIVFEPDYRNVEALRGIEGFDYLWLIWQFSENVRQEWSPTVRPPRLGGNKRVGVWATRSPFRPNALGLSSVRLLSVDLHTPDGPVLHIQGADLMDGTPIFDIKPYIPFTDSHPEARSGFVNTFPGHQVEVECSESLLSLLPEPLRQPLIEVLACDPRPSYHSDPTRRYVIPFASYEVAFKVEGNQLVVLEIVPVR